MEVQWAAKNLTFQDALRSPLHAYEALGDVQGNELSLNLIKILIDYKRGRLRQAYKRYRNIQTSLGFSPDQTLLEQTSLLDEETAQLIVFEIVFHITDMSGNPIADTNAYIEALDLFGPDDRVLYGALYNILLTLALRDGTHAIARQFAAMAIEEYRATNAPYLEGFIHLHLALVNIAEADYPAATHATEMAESLFRSVPETKAEIAQIEVIRAWIDLEFSNIAPDPSLLETVKSTMLAGELWGEIFLMLATVLFRSKILTGQDDVLEIHAELETVIRVRRMTSLMPAMQLMRDEYFALGSPIQTVSSHTGLDPFQLLLLQPTVVTLALNSGDNESTLPRLCVVQELQRGQLALKQRQFSTASDHIWPALDLIEAHHMHGVLNGALPIIETFLAECRARRRFVERARGVRQRLLFPLLRPKVAITVPSGLTATEYVIVTLLPHATSNKSMARQLDVSEPTIKFHLSNIYRKLNVNRRREAIKAAAARGWINLIEEPDQSGT